MKEKILLTLFSIGIAVTLSGLTTKPAAVYADTVTSVSDTSTDTENSIDSLSDYVLSTDPSSAQDPVTETPDVPDSNNTKIYNYNSNITFSGIYKTSSYYMNIEKYWDLQYAYACIQYTVSPLITDDVPASLTFFVNDTPVSSCKIHYEDGSVQILYVQIPTEYLKDGYNSFSISGYVRLYDDEGCLDDFSNANWVEISQDSNIEVGFNIIGDTEQLSWYPYPILSADDPSGADTGIFISSDATDNEITTALMLRADLGNETDEMDSISLMTMDHLNEKSQRIIVASADHLPDDIRTRVETIQSSLSGGCLVYLYRDDSGPVLLLTAESDADLYEGAAMLLDDDRLAQERSNSAFIKSGSANEKVSSTVVSELIENGTTLKGITNEDGMEFVGPFHQEQTVTLPVSSGFVLGEGGKISLDIRYADNLDFNRSMVTVYWEDTPIASHKLSRDGASGETFSFSIPQDVTGTHANYLTIAFDLELEDLECTKRADEMPWAYVSGSSTLYLPVGTSTNYSLSYRPYPFEQLGEMQDVLFVLPDSMTDMDLELAGAIAKLMGPDMNPYGIMQVKRASEYNAKQDDCNIIMIGTYENNTAIQNLNDNLSFAYTDGGMAFESNDQMIMSDDYAARVGILQIIRSPYVSGRAILIASGTDENSEESIIRFLSETDNLEELSGDSFLIDTDLESASYTCLKQEAAKKVSLTDRLKENRNAVIYSLAATAAMFLLALSAVLIIIRYNKNKNNENNNDDNE